MAHGQATGGGAACAAVFKTLKGWCVMEEKEFRQQVNWLIHTSVDDMRSSLQCSHYPLEVLQDAFDKASEQGMKTKAKVLDRYIQRMKKEASYARL